MSAVRLLLLCKQTLLRLRSLLEVRVRGQGRRFVNQLRDAMVEATLDVGFGLGEYYNI